MADGIVGAQADLGMALGLRSGVKRIRDQKIEDEDRQHTLARRTADDTYVDQTRVAADAQRAAQTAQTQANTQIAQEKLAKLKQGVEDEGALDFMYQINAGMDPHQAALNHNMRGTSKIIPESVQYDPQTKTVEFDAPSADDPATPVHQVFHVPETIGALEKITGKSQKGRFMNVADGADVFDTEQSKIVATNPKDPSASAAAAAGRGVKLGPHDRLVDPVSHKLLVPELTTSAQPRDTTLFNPQTYTKDVTQALGKLAGGKYDPSTEQFDFGGATAKMGKLSRIAQRQAQRMLKHKGRISADMVASIVNDLGQDFDEKAIREQARADAEAQIGGDDANQRDPGRVFGLGKIKPDVLKQRGDAAVQDHLATLESEVQTALDSEVARLADTEGENRLPSQDNQDALDNTPDDGQDAEPDADADEADNRPAVEWPADAPPQRAFQPGKALRSKKTGEVWMVGKDGLPHKVSSGK